MVPKARATKRFIRRGKTTSDVGLKLLMKSWEDKIMKRKKKKNISQADVLDVKKSLYHKMEKYLNREQKKL